MLDEKLKQVPDLKPLGSTPGDTAESILQEITQNYSFDRFINTWGPGRALYIPTEAWEELTEQQRDTLTKYSEKLRLRAINIGRLKEKNNMYIDSTIWENPLFPDPWR